MNLNQVTIPSQDLEISVPFYQSLGLILIVDSLPNYARFECPAGEATLSIHKVEKPPSHPGVYLYFECDDLEETYLKLCAKGMDFEEGPEARNWLWTEARLKDPDGNQIVLYHAGENRKNPPWRLK